MIEDRPYEAAEWLELMRLSARAQDRLNSLLLNLKYDLERGRGHSIIRSYSGRLKNLEGVKKKLARFHQEVTPQRASVFLHDIVGMRIICSYLSDIETVKNAILKMPEVRVFEIKDYIASPKPSGYRSMHILILLEVEGKTVAGEIQLRTGAMDSWAALEHQLRYKKDHVFSHVVNEELAQCALDLYQSDLKMQRIYDMIHAENARFQQHPSDRKSVV